MKKVLLLVLFMAIAHLIVRMIIKMWSELKKNRNTRRRTKVYYALLHAQDAPLRQVQLDYEATQAEAIRGHDALVYQAELDYKEALREAYRAHEDGHAKTGIDEHHRQETDNEYVWQKSAAYDRCQAQVVKAGKFSLSIEAEAREKRQLAIDAYLEAHPAFITEVLSRKATKEK